jgi:hypothetical protein
MQKNRQTLFFRYFSLSRVLEITVFLTPVSPSKFLMATFMRIFAQKVTAGICPVEPLVMFVTIQN